MQSERTEKVLVVDDSSFMRQLVIKAVEAAGYSNIVQASNGVEAISIFEQEQPDVMLMDLIMPEKTGLEVLAELVPKGAKIIVISAIGQQGIIDNAFTAGAKGYFVKPFFDESEVKNMIEEVLAGETVHPEAASEAKLSEYIEVAKHGAAKSAGALTTILGNKVRVVETGTSLTQKTDRLSDLRETAADSGVVAATGLLVGVAGAAYISLSDKNAYTLVDLLNGYDQGTTTSLSGEMERSTIEEVLNILSNSYLSVFGDLKSGLLAAELPNVASPKELPDLVEGFLARQNSTADDELVVFEAEFEIPETPVNIKFAFLICKEEIS